MISVRLKMVQIFLDSILTNCCHIKLIVIGSNIISYVEFWITLLIPKGTIIMYNLYFVIKHIRNDIISIHFLSL